MQLVKQLMDQESSDSRSIINHPRLRVGILGTGKIGVDLLIKVRRSNWLECVLFSGRNLQSDGMRYAASLGVPVTDKGIEAFKDPKLKCDLVFDATSASAHKEHAPVLAALGMVAIDMTPSQIGDACVPALGMESLQGRRNISMISCGGQSSIPLAHVLFQQLEQVSEISVCSRVAPDSIGPATLVNIQEYYANTRAGLRKYTGDIPIKVELLVDEKKRDTPMINTIRVATSTSVNRDQLITELEKMVNRVQAYVPGYRLISGPNVGNGFVELVVQVEGAGDYLPRFAGNLDIINCAALAVAEDFARNQLRSLHLDATKSSINKETQEQIEPLQAVAQ